MSSSAPQIRLVRGEYGFAGLSCGAATDSIKIIAATLGFVAPPSLCSNGIQTITLGRRVMPEPPLLPNVIAYGQEEQHPFQRREINTLMIVPDNIPFATAGANIVAYVQPDAAAVSFRTLTPVATAFALEDAGVQRSDILGEWPEGSGSMLVRVRPATSAQLFKIERIAKTDFPSSGPFDVFRFVRDCDATIASLDAAALQVARNRASVMADAAGTSVGEVLGVVDAGGAVRNAVCGGTKDSTIGQLVAALRKSDNSRGDIQDGGALAIVTHTLDAAWRLNLPDNSPGAPWNQNPYFSGRPMHLPDRRFVADGLSVEGDALVPDVLKPDWAEFVFQSDSSIGSLPFRDHLTFAPYVDAVTPALLFVDPSRTALGQDIVAVNQRLSDGNSPRPMELFVGRGDCGEPAAAAIYEATTNALAQIRGKRIRFLEELDAEPMGSFGCGYVKLPEQGFSGSVIPGNGGFDATVLAGY